MANSKDGLLPEIAAFEDGVPVATDPKVRLSETL